MTAPLLRSTANVGQITLLSRLSGFLRDMVVAQAFGAGAATDAFFVAFRIPNLFRRLFAEGSFAQAFVPVLTEYKERRKAEEVRSLVAHVAGVLLLVVALITVIGVLCAPAFIFAFAPGFAAAGDPHQLAVDMLRITFPYLFFIAGAALVGSVLNSYGRFAVPAFTPVLLNLAMIVAVLALAPRLERPIVALAWGVFAGGVLQLAFQLPFAARLGLLPRPRCRRDHEGVQRIMGLMLPTLFGGSVSQMNILLNTIIASTLATGSVSWLYYADRLVELPYGVVSVALGTVLLPRLAAQHAVNAVQEYSHALDWGLRTALILTVPAAVGLVLLAEPLLCTLFKYGAMTAMDVRMAARALSAYAIGLIGISLVKILTTALFARQDTRTPVRAGVITVMTNVVLSLTLVQFMAHAGLAAATAISAFIHAGLLYRHVRGSGIFRPEPGWLRLAVRLATATAAMSAMVWWLCPPLATWLEWTAFERGWHCLALIGLGGAVYAATLWTLGMRFASLHGPGSE